MAGKFHKASFYVITVFTLLDGHQRFGGISYVHLRGIILVVFIKMFITWPLLRLRQYKKQFTLLLNWNPLNKYDNSLMKISSFPLGFPLNPLLVQMFHLRFFTNHQFNLPVGHIIHLGYVYGLQLSLPLI